MPRKIWNIQALFYKFLRRNPVSARILKAENETASSLLERISPGQINRILDIGPGRGNSLKLLHSIQAHIFGLDLTRKMITKTRPEYSNVLFFQGDIVRLPVMDQRMDIITCLGVMEYIKYQKIALQEIYRVLRPGGYTLISLPRKSLLNYLRRLLGHRMYIPALGSMTPILRIINFELVAQKNTLLQSQLLLKKTIVS
jgi:ubiquinone/menaquinone biosynthesis C-methylase UbiE